MSCNQISRRMNRDYALIRKWTPKLRQLKQNAALLEAQAQREEDQTRRRAIAKYAEDLKAHAWKIEAQLEQVQRNITALIERFPSQCEAADSGRRERAVRAESQPRASLRPMQPMRRVQFRKVGRDR
ncbi:MAG: hypothetical protein HY078_02300 [Elusimicrobia bacterium]|nr:hypothetical protein [Elusimicrobiota bacterium]